MRIVGQGGTVKTASGVEIELQGGGSINEASIYLGIDKHTYYHLCEDFPEFFHAEQERHALCLNWWETVGKDISKKNIGSAKGYEFNMINRFRNDGYALRKEVDLSSKDGSMTPARIDTSKLTTEQLAALHAALAPSGE